ncbi:unnamed protein product [Cochlearia groenlandica]
MGILFSCLRAPRDDDESQDVDRIRALALSYPITNNFLPKFEQLSQNLQSGKVSFVKDDEEDVCPTCFYEYIEENPKIILQCGHIFHLSCIYEWMERSESCPFCSKTMLFLESEITKEME